MSISNYTELQAAIESWIKRSDLTAMVPDFIRLAEARINRVFLPRSIETETELTMTVGSRFVPVPADMINPVALWLKAWIPRTRLTQRLPEELPVKTNVTGYAQYWAIDNGNIAFDVLAYAASAFDFRYTATATLSVANPTNYTLTNNPDLYLWGALVEACNYAIDPQQSALYESRYQAAMQDAQNNENDTRAIAPMMTEIGTLGRSGRPNIIRGY